MLTNSHLIHGKTSKDFHWECYGTFKTLFLASIPSAYINLGLPGQRGKESFLCFQRRHRIPNQVCSWCPRAASLRITGWYLKGVWKSQHEGRNAKNRNMVTFIVLWNLLIPREKDSKGRLLFDLVLWHYSATVRGTSLSDLAASCDSYFSKPAGSKHVVPF